MKNLRLILIAFLIPLPFLPFTTSAQLSKKVLGHWGTNNFMGYYEQEDTLGLGDTVTFTKIKFNSKFYYRGGGYMSGIEFKPDSGFTQYRNVGCSDESDIKIGFDEKYFFVNDSVAEVNSILRNFRFKILLVNSKKLTVKILSH